MFTYRKNFSANQRLENSLCLFHVKSGIEEHFMVLTAINLTTGNEENIHITLLCGSYAITPTFKLPYQFPLKSLRQQENLIHQLYVINRLIFL